MSSLKYANTDITIKMVIITPKVLEDDSLSESKVSILRITDSILICII
ncbi:hypothetical protein 14D047_00243 [Fowlpox virus]|nr:hypothetical protein 13D121_00245 [Fowlpox virus]URH25484.1 hypothetical protein 14D047_00243 [Fowlpox virus]URH26003.1 hypothetical protein 18Q061_00243 [Fowlpox virus]URH26267.1 hypothetical protein 18R056_00244 [Fowlpox virus]URH26530.1 hypothetical protein 18R059_00244 [Fowlpox virus]